MTSPQGPQASGMSTPRVTNRPQMPPSGSVGGTEPPVPSGPAGPVPPSPGGMPPTAGGIGAMPGMIAGDSATLQMQQQPAIQVATFANYAEAQRAVDFLSDQGFPVQNTKIVGSNLHLVEQVLGRMTTGRAAMSGLGAGAWLGLFVGLLLGLFAVGGWLAVVLTAVVIGAIWGAIFGAIAHATTRGQRDFSSRSRLEATEYAVQVIAPYADDARALLGRLQWTR